MYKNFNKLLKEKRYFFFPLFKRGLEVLSNLFFFREVISLILQDTLFFFNYLVTPRITFFIISRAYYNLTFVKENYLREKEPFFPAFKKYILDFFPLRDRYYFLGKLPLRKKLFLAVKRGPYILWAWFYYSFLQRIVAFFGYGVFSLVAGLFFLFPANVRDYSVIYEWHRSGLLKKRYTDPIDPAAFRLDMSILLRMYLEILGVIVFQTERIFRTVYQRDLVQYCWQQRRKYNIKRALVQKLAKFFAWLFVFSRGIYTKIASFMFYTFYFLGYSLYLFARFFYLFFSLAFNGFVLIIANIWRFRLTAELNIFKKFTWVTFLFNVVFFLLSAVGAFLCLGYFLSAFGPLFFSSLFYVFYGPSLYLKVLFCIYWLPLIILSYFYDYWREIYNEVKYLLFTWTLMVYNQFFCLGQKIEWWFFSSHIEYAELNQEQFYTYNVYSVFYTVLKYLLFFAD